MNLVIQKVKMNVTHVRQFEAIHRDSMALVELPNLLVFSMYTVESVCKCNLFAISFEITRINVDLGQLPRAKI